MLKTQTSILLVAIGAAMAMSACGSGSNSSSSNTVAASLAPASSGATNSTATGSTTGSTASGSGTASSGTASSGSATSGSGTASSGTSTGTSTGANTGSGSTTPVSPPIFAVPTDYISANQVWTNKRPKSYQYTAQRSCFCLVDQTLPYTITVDGGRIVSIIHAEQDIVNSKPDYLPTIDYVFGRIQNAIAQNAAKIAVTYNPEYGFPEKTSIDISTMIADEEEYYQISNFKVLP